MGAGGGGAPGPSPGFFTESGSIDFLFGFVRLATPEKFTALQPDRKPGLFSDDLGNEKACFIMS